MSWKLDERAQTSAGIVAAGRLGSGPALVLVHGWLTGIVFIGTTCLGTANLT
jgi:hypothetical protein